MVTKKKPCPEPLRLLKANNWFRNASSALREALASAMTLEEVDDGHVFVQEGSTSNLRVLLLQEGTLVRSRLAMDVESIQHAYETMTGAELRQHSIIIDEISQVGKMLGVLYNLEQGESGDAATPAFATIAASGPAKVWIIPGKQFRTIVSSQPQFALDLMAALAREVRSGSKSLKSVLKQAQDSKEESNGESGDIDIFRVLCYDASSWTTQGFQKGLETYNDNRSPNDAKISLDYTNERLSEHSVTHAAGYDAVCLFVNDIANASVLKALSLLGVRLVLLRCAGYDRVDTKAALAYKLTVARVPAYSPYAVAEMAMALLMAVNRKINKAANRVRMANFTLDAGLMGTDIHGKTVGVMGTGTIGIVLCNILLGFGVNLLCCSHSENEDIKARGGRYVSKDELFAQSDILFLMMPLLPSTRHAINHSVLPQLKKGVILINTSRGGLVDTKALLEGLRQGIIGGVGMDVYEREQDYFYQDWSAKSIDDPDLEALIGNHNVVLTAHQAFFTTEAVTQIVGTTLENIRNFHNGAKGLAHPNNCIPVPKPLFRKRSRSDGAAAHENEIKAKKWTTERVA